MGRARFSDVCKTASVLLLWTVFACSCWRSAAGEGVTDVTLEQWDDTIKKNPYVLLLVCKCLMLHVYKRIFIVCLLISCMVTYGHLLIILRRLVECLSDKTLSTFVHT